jgi:outer membrane protein OmpA-like peptidoglycan-associated protein
MNKTFFALLSRPLMLGTLLLIVLTGNISAALAADEALPQQSGEIETLLRRAEKLVAGGMDPDNYHLAKARTWLDLALSEHYEKDDSGIIPAAIRQAGNLLDALEQKQTDISMHMPLQTEGSESVRPDLWDKIATLKKHEKFSCGQRPTAEAEVYLIWAGHELAESGQSHAEPYIRTVENRIYTAQVAIDNCAAAPAAEPNLPPPPPPLPQEKITLSGDALFAFDKATLNPSALWRLDNLADEIKAVNQLEKVVLVGHTDRLRSDKHGERNQLLSEQRAESIKQYLVGKGIPADKIHASGAGSSQPLVQCSTKQSKQKQIDCLQPNRRVEIILRGSKTPADNKDNGNKESVK